MPTISIHREDFQQLLGNSKNIAAPMTAEAIEPWLALVKGELKDQDRETGELRVELQDSNRPDLWSCEGIARQIRIKLAGAPNPYCFFEATPAPGRRLLVSSDLERVRPYVAACAAVGYEVTETGLAQLIQAQEKLADIFGRQRRTVSVGLYRLFPIVFPIRYELVGLDDARFTPLGSEETMSLREILTLHPKGLEYAPILAGHARVPLLLDDEGHVLSFPPIINSREIGEVRVGDRSLLLEVTGTDLRMVLLTLNIMAANLADRGAAIEPIEVIYPYDTDFGKTLRTPMDFGKFRPIAIRTIQSSLGQSLEPEDIRQALLAYGYEASLSGESVSVKLPPYRNDLMHAVDVTEDVAVSIGYASFAPVMPSDFTVGGLSRLEQCSDRVRDVMVGMGFQEVMSNILTSRSDVVERMRASGSQWGAAMEVDNVMSQNFACLRQSILPSLLRVESASTRAFYPHRVFEAGETVIPDERDSHGGRTVVAVAALIAHAGANFSEVHSCVDVLFYYLGQAYDLEPVAHPSFLDGRAGRIRCGGQDVGLIGELHPEVLENWQIAVPCAAFELTLDFLAQK